MAIRLSGLASGMDTDTIIKGIVDAQKLKNKKVSDKSQILDWKKDKLKELNTKLYKLYSEDLTKLRLSSAYSTKKVTSSNENVVSVTGNSSAPTGTHSIEVKALASSQYVTGGVIANGSSDAKLVGDLKIAQGTVITITTDKGTKDITIDSSMTLSSFASQCKAAGVNANYDSTQKRLFFSSKESGADNWFTISGNVSNANLGSIGSLSDEEKNTLKTADKAELEKVITAIKGGNSIDGLNTELVTTVTKIYDSANDKIVTNAKLAATQTVKDGLTAAIKAGTTYENKDWSDVKKEITDSTYDKLKADYPDDSSLKYDDFYEKHKTEFDKLVDEGVASKVEKLMESEDIRDIITAKENEYVTTAKTTLGNDIINFANTDTTTDEQLSKLGLSELTSTKDTTTGKVTVSSASANVKVINANNSEVLYNGVTLTGNSNTLTVNGLTLELKGLSNGDNISLNVTNDTQATFDTIKKFITNYNSILKELNNLYYADSARGYDPLSDDEKEAMTDAQIEKWETKIKDSMLRRDSNIGTIITTLKTSVMQSVEASNGKRYSLASFGIGTSSDYSEKGLLHIDGDPDDSAFSNETDKLMSALESDPDIVAEILSKTISNLYQNIDKNIKAIPNVRSAFTFYNDKLMTNQQTEYKKKITELDKKVTELENKYYKQFSAMETAMAKLQSQSNALAGMLGTGTN